MRLAKTSLMVLHVVVNSTKSVHDLRRIKIVFRPNGSTGKPRKGKGISAKRGFASMELPGRTSVE